MVTNSFWVFQLRNVGAIARAPGRGVDTKQDERHVIVLRRIADKCRDFAQDAFSQLVGGQVRMFFQ